MILDTQLELSAAQSLVGAAGTTISTNVIDQGSAVDQHIDSDIRLVCLVGAAFTGLTSLDIQIQTDDNVAFSSPRTIASSTPIATAGLTAGAMVLDLEIPRGSERYLRLAYVTVGTTTAGTITSELVVDSQRNRAAPIAYTVA